MSCRTIPVLIDEVGEPDEDGAELGKTGRGTVTPSIVVKKGGGPFPDRPLAMDEPPPAYGVTTRMNSFGSASKAAGTVTVMASTGSPLFETGVTAGVKLVQAPLRLV